MSQASEKNVLIFASTGDLSQLIRCEYWVRGRKYDSYFSVEAIAEGLGGRAVKLIMLFVQDSLIINRLVKGNDELEELLRSSLTRETLRDYLLKKCWISSGLSDSRHRVQEIQADFKRLCDRFPVKIHTLPGIASGRRGAYVYLMQGGDHLYSALVAGITGYALRELREHLGGGSALVVVDTTHGINYFAHALVEGVSLACSLYVLRRAGEPVGVELQHFNSDPLVIFEQESNGVSLRINSVSSKTIGVLVVPLLKEFFENFIADYGNLSRAAEALANHWKNSNRESWERALASCLTLVRGAPLWALTFAQDVDVPKLGEILRRLESLKIKATMDQNTLMKIKYAWDEESCKPLLEVLVVSEVVDSLKDISGRIRASSEVLRIVRETLRAYSGEGEDTVKRILEWLEQKGDKAPIFKADDLERVVFSIYPVDTRCLCSHEVDEFRKWLKKICAGGKTDIQERRGDDEKRDRHINSIKICGDKCKILVLLERELAPRHFFAHAGFAEGTPILFAMIGDDLYVCSYSLPEGREYERVLNLIKSLSPQGCSQA